VFLGVGPKGPVTVVRLLPQRLNPAWRLVLPPSPCRINTKSKHQYRSRSLQCG